MAESRLERQFRRQCRICDSLGLKRMMEILKEETETLRESTGPIIIVEVQRPD